MKLFVCRNPTVEKLSGSVNLFFCSSSQQIFLDFSRWCWENAKLEHTPLKHKGYKHIEARMLAEKQ